jgi:hypothetical protein
MPLSEKSSWETFDDDDDNSGVQEILPCRPLPDLENDIEESYTNSEIPPLEESSLESSNNDNSEVQEILPCWPLLDPENDIEESNTNSGVLPEIRPKDSDVNIAETSNTDFPHSKVGRRRRIQKRFPKKFCNPQ